MAHKGDETTREEGTSKDSVPGFAGYFTKLFSWMIGNSTASTASTASTITVTTPPMPTMSDGSRRSV